MATCTERTTTAIVEVEFIEADRPATTIDELAEKQKRLMAKVKASGPYFHVELPSDD